MKHSEIYHLRGVFRGLFHLWPQVRPEPCERRVLGVKKLSTHACNPSSQEVEEGGWSILDQPWLHSKTLYKEKEATRS
jgi:hypothetical protein